MVMFTPSTLLYVIDFLRLAAYSTGYRKIASSAYCDIIRCVYDPED